MERRERGRDRREAVETREGWREGGRIVAADGNCSVTPSTKQFLLYTAHIIFVIFMQAENRDQRTVMVLLACKYTHHLRHCYNGTMYVKQESIGKAVHVRAGLTQSSKAFPLNFIQVLYCIMGSVEVHDKRLAYHSLHAYSHMYKSHVHACSGQKHSKVSPSPSRVCHCHP